MAVLAGGLWAAFAVELGDKSLAEHVDTISETPEAKELVEGTRSTINPALMEVRDRVLGEYVEAPTWIPPDDQVEQVEQVEQTAQTARTEKLDQPSRPESARAASEAKAQPSTDAEPPLPGRRSERRLPSFAEGFEPALPGRR